VTLKKEEETGPFFNHKMFSFSIGHVLMLISSVKNLTTKRRGRLELLSPIRKIGHKEPRYVNIITAIDSINSDMAVWENFEFSTRCVN
jgi:hypothetical protein